jgi:hypothetical protein
MSVTIHRSSLARMRNYYRLFRSQSGRMKSLYFALRLTV